MSEKIVLSDDDDIFKHINKSKSQKLLGGKDKKSSIFVPDGDYGDDVIFVEPENYSPRKKQKLEEEKRTLAIPNSSTGKESDISVVFDRKGIDFPHAREHCRVNKFIQSSLLTEKNSCNEKFCEKCYCYVCDDLSSKCELWKTGEKPHCNAFAKNEFWEKERRLHKRNLKKSKFVSILTLVTASKLNKEISSAASSCKTYIGQIEEISNLSYNVTRNPCRCVCHLDDYQGCHNCEREHRNGYFYHGNSSHSDGYRVTQKLKDIISNATALATSYLVKNKPSSAVVVLDTISSLLFEIDINRQCSFYKGDLSRLVSCWIEAALHRNVDKDLLSKAKERIFKSAKSASEVFCSEAKRLNGILSELKAYDDPLVVECFKQPPKGSGGLKEDYVVAKIRLEYLKKSKRIPEAINYMLGVETETIKKSDKMCNFDEQRKDLIELLIQSGRIEEASNVCSIPFTAKLSPCDLKKSPRGIVFVGNSLCHAPTTEMTFGTFKRLLTGLVQPQSSSTSASQNKNTSEGNLSKLSTFEERLLKAMCFILPLMYINYTMNLQEALDLVFDVVCSQGNPKNYKYPDVKLCKDVQESAKKLIDTKAKKELKLKPEDLTSPSSQVPMQVYFIEILSLVASARLTVGKCMLSLVKQKLYWACISLIISPYLRDVIFPSDVEYFTEKILPNTGSTGIPTEIFEKWFEQIDPMHYFKSLFKLTCEIYEEGNKKKGAEGAELKKKAVQLSQKLKKSVLMNSFGHSRKAIEGHISAIQEKFTSETPKGHGASTNKHENLEVEFVCSPSLATLEFIRLKSKNKEQWLQKKETLLQFLQKNCRYYTNASIQIYSKLEMYKELENCLSWSAGFSANYDDNCATISKVLQEAKQTRNNPSQKQLAEAMVEFVGIALERGSFPFASRKDFMPISPQVMDCVQLFYNISKSVFFSIIRKAINEVTQKYVASHVNRQKRCDLIKWLLQIKTIFISVNERKEWLVTIQMILEGPLQRKQALILAIRSEPDLF